MEITGKFGALSFLNRKRYVASGQVWHTCAKISKSMGRNRSLIVLYVIQAILMCDEFGSIHCACSNK